MIKPNLVLVDESAIYGGHESMLMSFLRGILLPLSSVFNVYFVVNSQNKKLIFQLESNDFQEISVLKISLSKIPMKPITQFFIVNDSLKMKSTLKGLNPKLVLNIQGTIEIGCMTLWACRSLGIEVFSYLPITKSSASLNVFLGRTRDFLCKALYYPIPQKIITISNSNSKELTVQFDVPTENISVVHNFVEHSMISSCVEVPKFKDKRRHLALIGRISNTQKCQFDFLNAWLKFEFIDQYVIHIVGDDDGQESQAIKALGEQAVSAGSIVFHGWQSQNYVSEVLRRCDTLLLPSRFEGVPLVMIEAIALGCLVVGTAVDGMKEFLPEELTFGVADWSTMFEIIQNTHQSDKTNLLLDIVRERFEVFNQTRNTQTFLNLLMERSYEYER
ncbi:glycosyltransferase [Paraglaciecola sp. 20A4]|uniref:glycosyltransferase family 4 protein n=1 Tax=Paraglaciecola sp. 20A4 TaxID=2687288 RepID=UPI00140CF4AC|nr:glycosyltransferase [Paraglaciecola sp. 20A4]